MGNTRNCLPFYKHYKWAQQVGQLSQFLEPLALQSPDQSGDLWPPSSNRATMEEQLQPEAGSHGLRPLLWLHQLLDNHDSLQVFGGGILHIEKASLLSQVEYDGCKLKSILILGLNPNKDASRENGFSEIKVLAVSLKILKKVNYTHHVPKVLPSQHNTNHIKSMKLVNLFLILPALVVACLASTLLPTPTSAYSLLRSKEYVQLAFTAQCPKKCIESWSCKDAKKYPLTNVTHFNNAVSLAAAYVGYRADTNQIVVAFRGSVNVQNWIQDFTFQLVDYPGCEQCKIHLGFFDDYKLIESKINEKVVSLIAKNPTASILSTGYSLGAALSLVAGLRLKEKFPSRMVEVHNFGQPRVGNKALATYAHERMDSMYRVVHNRDLIPHLPFESMGYRHSARQIFFNQKMTEYKQCSWSGEDSQCSNHFDPAYNPIDHKFYFYSVIHC